jgi:hypothetical protein
MEHDVRRHGGGATQDSDDDDDVPLAARLDPQTRPSMGRYRCAHAAFRHA